jgi:hypothetical protein
VLEPVHHQAILSCVAVIAAYQRFDVVREDVDPLDDEHVVEAPVPDQPEPRGARPAAGLLRSS